MLERKIICPCCKVEYIQEIRLKNKPHSWYVCTECEAIYIIDSVDTIHSVDISQMANFDITDILDKYDCKWEDIEWEDKP